MVRETGHSLIFGWRDRAIRVGADESMKITSRTAGWQPHTARYYPQKLISRLSIINYIRYNDTVLAILEYSAGLVGTGEKIKGESK